MLIHFCFLPGVAATGEIKDEAYRPAPAPPDKTTSSAGVDTVDAAVTRAPVQVALLGDDHALIKNITKRTSHQDGDLDALKTEIGQTQLAGQESKRLNQADLGLERPQSEDIKLIDSTDEKLKLVHISIAETQPPKDGPDEQLNEATVENISEIATVSPEDLPPETEEEKPGPPLEEIVVRRSAIKRDYLAMWASLPGELPD